ncbi:hypothetical protein Leryth_001856 [Lithospermum erythrorhizon]|nr:hypothetical protein Leryth_001856 [Lithospermum erythrorhizon]
MFAAGAGASPLLPCKQSQDSILLFSRTFSALPPLQNLSYELVVGANLAKVGFCGVNVSQDPLSGSLVIPLMRFCPRLVVKELYGIDSSVVFRDVTIPSENRPRSLHLGTATQIGVIPTEGIPSLLKVLLPSNCTGLPVQ